MTDPLWIDTPLGGQVHLGPPSEGLAPDLSMLVLKMQDPADPRYAEIALSEQNLADLGILIRKRLEWIEETRVSEPPS